MYTFTERGIWVEQIIDLKEVGRVLIKKRRKIINITVACMVLGGAYAFLAPSTYQSTSMLRIKQAQGLSNSVLSSANAYSDSMSRQLMNTDAEILKSRNVVEPVITAIEILKVLVMRQHMKILLKLALKLNRIKKPSYYK